MKKVYLGLFVFIIAAVFIPGCYTMIEHPEVVSTTSEYAHPEKIKFYEDCQSCHSSAGTEYVKAENYIEGSEEVTENGDSEYVDPRGGEGRPPIVIIDYGNPATYYDGGYTYYYNTPWWYSSSSASGSGSTKVRTNSTVGRSGGGTRSTDPNGGRPGNPSGGTTVPPAAPVTRAPSSGSSSTSTSSQGSSSSTDSKSSDTRGRDSNSGSTGRNDGGRSSGGKR